MPPFLVWRTSKSSKFGPRGGHIPPPGLAFWVLPWTLQPPPPPLTSSKQTREDIGEKKQQSYLWSQESVCIFHLYLLLPALQQLPQRRRSAAYHPINCPIRSFSVLFSWHTNFIWCCFWLLPQLQLCSSVSRATVCRKEQIVFLLAVRRRRTDTLDYRWVPYKQNHRTFAGGGRNLQLLCSKFLTTFHDSPWHNWLKITGLGGRGSQPRIHHHHPQQAFQHGHSSLPQKWTTPQGSSPQS